MNQHPAIAFLSHLDPSSDAQFNIEHYTDVPKGVPRPKPDPLMGRHPNLTLLEVENLLHKLHAVNDRGAGIFVARNQCSGQRSERTITRVRGVHADMDDVSEEQLNGLVAVLQPSIIVKSSPGRYQFYWQLAEGEALRNEEAKAINQFLAQEHGADPAAVDVSRLLRLPGFKHMKYRNQAND